LHREAEAWHKSQRLRAYIDAVRAAATADGGNIESGSELGLWLVWASEQADRIDPLLESPPSDQKQIQLLLGASQRADPVGSGNPGVGVPEILAS